MCNSPCYRRGGPTKSASVELRVYGSPGLGGLFMSASGFTPRAVAQCVRALEQRTCMLCALEELVRVVDAGGSLGELLTGKVRAARQAAC